MATGVIADTGIVYLDVRRANSAPTLELRVCDSCPSVDTILLIAGLFRALVDRETEGLRAATPALTVSPPLSRAALWRAARSGLEFGHHGVAPVVAAVVSVGGGVRPWSRGFAPRANATKRPGRRRSLRTPPLTRPITFAALPICK